MSEFFYQLMQYLLNIQNVKIESGIQGTGCEQYIYTRLEFIKLEVPQVNHP
jgi:hypothetical protein